MIKYLNKRKLSVTSSLIFAIIGNLAMVLTPYYLGRAIDVMIGMGKVDFVSVRQELSTAVVLYIISFIFVWLSNYVSFLVSSKVVTEIREDLIDKIARLPLSYLDTHSHGKLTNMVTTDSDLILEGLFQLLSQILGGIVVIVVATIFMLKINLTMTLVVYATIPLVYISSYWVSKNSTEAFKEQQILSGKLNGFVGEAIHNHKLIMNYNYQDTILEKFKLINDDYNKAGQRAQFVSSLTNPTTRVVNNLSFTVLGLVGAYTILSGDLTVGFFTSFISYSIMFAKPFNELSANLSQVFAAQAGFRNLEQVWKEVEILDQGKIEIESDGSVSFENVDFSYSKDRQLITDLNLEVKPKEKIAIVGPTGAGKSTLINILMRYYEVDAGTVKLDGTDITDLSLDSLRNNLSIVLQDPWLFEGTVKDNIRYGRKDATLEEVMEAAKKADCHDMIMSLDDGYDTVIQRGASNISNGQRQLITIARALLYGGPVLILDEATSNIDSLTEKRIQSVFTKIMKEHTSFFVAHRLSTVVDSDLILVMKNGKIVEKGTHRELMKEKGFYHQLYQSQF